jgi:hypothetical protein
MRVQLLLSIMASQSDMAIIIRSKGTHVLVYGACSILLRLITLSMQVTLIGAREHLLNFQKYILGYMLYVRKSGGEREGWYFRR